VRYDQVNALLNEILKEHRKNENQQATISELKLAVAEQQSRVAHQEKQIAILTSAIERASTQREVNRLRSRLVTNNN
jgi:uncharacterized coiled-coil protein SlyX